MTTNATEKPGGTFTLPGTDIHLNRMGYGAMRLTGPGIFGPPKNENEAISVLREAVAAGVNHIDTSDFYGPHVANQLIRKALHPYPAGLTLVTKVGARRGPKAEWLRANSREELISAVEDNLRNLGLDALDVVNYRIHNTPHEPATPVEGPMTVLAELQQQGKIKHLGISAITPEQFAAGEKIAKIVCVQNEYNVAYRKDDAFIAELAKKGIAYVPFFPLGGFSPLQSNKLEAIAKSINATPMQLALAWLLQHSPNMLLIPGTSSVAHLHENLAAAKLKLTPEVVKQMDEVAGDANWKPFSA